MGEKQNAKPCNAELSARNNSANVTDPVGIIVLTGRNMSCADNRLLAQRMKMKHKNSLELVKQNEAEFLELGAVPFQMEKPRGSNRSCPKRFGLVNEEHAHLLLSYSCNTVTVSILIAARRKAVRALAALHGFSLALEG